MASLPDILASLWGRMQVDPFIGSTATLAALFGRNCSDGMEMCSDLFCVTLIGPAVVFGLALFRRCRSARDAQLRASRRAELEASDDAWVYELDDAEEEEVVDEFDAEMEAERSVLIGDKAWAGAAAAAVGSKPAKASSAVRKSRRRRQLLDSTSADSIRSSASNRSADDAPDIPAPDGAEGTPEVSGGEDEEVYSGEEDGGAGAKGTPSSVRRMRTRHHRTWSHTDPRSGEREARLNRRSPYKKAL